MPAGGAAWVWQASAPSHSSLAVPADILGQNGPITGQARACGRRGGGIGARAKWRPPVGIASLLIGARIGGDWH